MPDLSKIFLYRMIHVENVQHILKHGITNINSPNSNDNYKPIGDGTLITRRNNFVLPNGRKLGDYIPFYFGVYMPMLYVIQKGFNNVKSTSAEKIVYCVTSIEKIINHNLDFIFSDGHSIEKFTSFFDKLNVNDIDKLIDLKAIESKYWKDDNDLDKKRRKEAEFLVLNDIPKDAILGFVVYNEAAKQQIIDYGVEEKKAIIRETYYFKI